MRDTAGSMAAPAASCRNCLRCGSFIRSSGQRGRAVTNSRRSLCRGLRRRLPRDEFPALWRFCPGVEEYEPQAARLAVDLRLDRRSAGDECGVARKAHLAIAAGRALVLRLSRAQGGKPRRLGVSEPRGVGIEKFVVKHRLERGEIAAAHRCIALVLEGEDFLFAAHRQTSLAVSPGTSCLQLAWRLPSLDHLFGAARAPAVRRTGFMKRRHASLVRLDVCELDYLGPLLHVF